MRSHGGTEKVPPVPDITNQFSSNIVMFRYCIWRAVSLKVTKTTEEDINANEETFMYECTYCTRNFPSQNSLSCHNPRWCPKVITAAAAARPRRNQRANKIIEAKKRAIKVEAQAKIKLNGELITNVEI